LRTHERLVARDVELEMARVVGEHDGPTLALLGGVHGDELEGIAAVRMLLSALEPATLRGEVRAVAVANPPAFEARTRCSPDGGNLARAFPGDAEGSVAEQAAQLLTEHVIAGADLLIDLHSAGSAYAMPWFVGYVSLPDAPSPKAAAAAGVFGAPLRWEHDSINPGRSLSAALELGVPALYVECSGGSALRRDEVVGSVDGVRRVMRSLGMLDEPAPDASPGLLLVGGTGDVDRSVSCTATGWCLTAVQAGDRVEPGALVAEILGADGTVVEQIRAPVGGTVMLLRRHAEVEAGDGIAMFGPVSS
jgi:N2-acetyl-L-2,4-diaminobutanoate deacetylase